MNLYRLYIPSSSFNSYDTVWITQKSGGSRDLLNSYYDLLVLVQGQNGLILGYVRNFGWYNDCQMAVVSESRSVTISLAPYDFGLVLFNPILINSESFLFREKLFFTTFISYIFLIFCH